MHNMVEIHSHVAQFTMYGVIIVLLCTCICCTKETWAITERQCSRYHYEEQILSKQIRMEIRLENLENKIKNMQQHEEVKKTCDDEWISFHTSCYLFGTNSVSFAEAKTISKALDAHLVSIQDASENGFIKRRVAEWSAPRFWIGLTDVMNEGDWRWTGTDEKVQFFGWNTVEPNGGTGSNCVAVSSDHKNNWIDEPCTNRQYRHICEK